MTELTFTKEELLLIESVLTPSALASDGKDVLPVTVPDRELVLKVGAALLASEAGTPEPVLLTEQEAWALRERVSVFAAVGKQLNAGLSVKLKVYAVLLAYDEAQLTAKLGLPVVGTHEEQGKADVVAALELKRALERQEAASHEQERRARGKNPGPHKA